MQVRCPGCGEDVPVQGGEAADDGRVRLKCPGCNARLLLKINRPDLKIDGRIPIDDGDGDAPPTAARSSSLEALERFSIDVGSGEFSTTGAGLRVVVVQSLPEPALEELKRQLIRIPRFRRNPNKIHDATAELPFVLQGLEQEEADTLEALVGQSGGACIAGPEWRILDGAGQPRELRPLGEPIAHEEVFGEADEALVVMGEADEDEGLLFASSDDGEVLVAGDDGEVLVAGDDGDADLGPPSAPAAAPEEPDPIELALKSYDDLIAVVTSDHMPSVEIPPDDLRLVTVETMPDQGEPLGIVSVTVEVLPSAAAGSRTDAVASAIREAEGRLQVKARQLGASMIVAIRTTASDLNDGTLLVVMQGTATRYRSARRR